MANDLNKFQCIGRLGKDPESRFMPDGSQIVGFTVALAKRYKDKQGNKQEKTEWVNITAFGKLADICAQYLKKGSRVYCEGELRTDKYDKDGETRYSTKIVLNNMQMLDSRDVQQQAPQQQRAQQQVDDFDDFDDTQIPF